MGFLIKGNKIYRAKEVKLMLDPVKKKILKILAKKELTLKEIARKLNISEQLAYHHLKRLYEYGYVERLVKDKIYYKTSKVLFTILDDSPDGYFRKFENELLENLFYPIVNKGFLDGIIVVGSPDPHGPFSARARDSHYVGYLSLILGKIVDQTKFNFPVKIDTDVILEKLYNENLIVIGGPITNMITYRLNTTLKVRFLQEFNWDIYSDFSQRRYSDELTGLIAKIRNPWNPKKWILLFAGKRAIGTKIAIKYIENLKVREHNELYIILLGKDMDGDGKVDKIEVLEETIVS